MTKTITLEFTRFYMGITRAMDRKSGIYKVYAYDKTTAYITRLLYIGESKNIYERLSDKDHQQDWLEAKKPSENICYTYAEAPSEDRVRAQDAMIFHEKPVCNTMSTKSFNHDDTTIVIKGLGDMGPEDDTYTVYKGSSY